MCDLSSVSPALLSPNAEIIYQVLSHEDACFHTHSLIQERQHIILLKASSTHHPEPQQACHTVSLFSSCAPPSALPGAHRAPRPPWRAGRGMRDPRPGDQPHSWELEGGSSASTRLP